MEDYTAKMRTSQKIGLTVIIAVLITGGFALIAYTGLFRLLETDFFSSRVESDQRLRLGDVADTIVLWNQENLSRFDALSRDRNMQSVFSISQRQEEILYRAQLSDSLKDQLLGFNGIRIIDNAGRIQFSSFAGDIGSRQFGIDTRIVYSNWNETKDSFELPIADEDSIASAYYDEANQQVRYQLPIQDWGFVTRGWMIVYMGLSGLTDRLARDGSIAEGANLYVVEGRGIITDIRPEQVAAVKGEIDVLWPVDGVPSEFSVLARGLDGKYWLGGTVSGDGTWVGKLIPGNLFGFSDSVRMLILSTVFLTSILFVFLLLNLRQDKTEVLRGRIKSLQVNLLRSWLEHQEDRKLLPKDFEARREEVRTELRSGLGKLREDESAKADEMIDKGWTRIAEILAEKENEATSIGSNAVAQQTPIDMKLLENMIARAISVSQTPQTKVEKIAELEQAPLEADEISELEQAPLEAEEIPKIAEEDAELEELIELESDSMVLNNAGELAGVRRVETSDNHAEVERGDVAHSGVRKDSEALEILPVVLADDFGELVEIDNVKQTRLYMFDKAADATFEDAIDNLKPLDESDEGTGDLEEIDEPDAADRLDSKPESRSVNSVMFIPIAEVVRKYRKAKSDVVNDEDGHFRHSDSMESLMKTKPMGILPGTKSNNEDLHFANEVPELSWREDGIDYDRYLRDFESDSTGICKSLMKLSKEYRAICGALFLSSEKGLVTDYAVGLSDECAAQLSVARGDKLWSEWFDKRLVVFIPELSNSPYSGITKHHEFRYIRAAVFIPIIYDGNSSYLFLGFKEAPEDPMGLLVGTAAL